MTKQFRGSYTVAITPFTENGEAVCVKSLKRFIDWQIESRAPGIIILGTTGEFLALSEDERNLIIETTVAHADGRLDVLVGSMDAYTPKAVRFSRQAEELGADGLMIIPPYYYTPTEDEIHAYYKVISEAVSLPIMLYNNPVTSNVDMSADLVARLTRDFDNVRYIKEASMDVGRVYDIVERTEGVMNVFAGERPVESFLLGAVGYVNPYGNYLPYSTSRLWDFLVEGHIEPARKIAALLAEMDEIVSAGHPTYGHQCYSKALAEAAGCPVGDVRPPLTRFAQLGAEGVERRDKLFAVMKKIEDLTARFEAELAA